MTMYKPILDACCGSKSFWFDKNNPNVVFCDIREPQEYILSDGQCLKIEPDIVCDFTSLPFADESFKLVVFDPPHGRTGEGSNIRAYYGTLENGWEQMLHDGFCECMRVLEEYGVLIFKWAETDYPVSRIIEIIGTEPLFGHKSGKQSRTHWMCFMKLKNKEGI